jgi:predicted Holliday junction resolvase-like endonuclease
VEEKVQNVEMKPSLLKMKEEISKLEAKLELALSRQRDIIIVSTSLKPFFTKFLHSP